jgi:hypothetical protein
MYHRTIGPLPAIARAGYAVQHVALALPLFIGGTIKIVYDVLLRAAFRHVGPPEERD